MAVAIIFSSTPTDGVDESHGVDGRRFGLDTWSTRQMLGWAFAGLKPVMLSLSKD
jgi:hypothetical protein